MPLLKPLLLALLPLTHAIDKTANPDLTARLKQAASTYDRHALLSTDTAWTYDFTSATPTDAFRPGSVKNANAATFPALAGLGMTMAQLNLGPCAMLAPHHHPRGTNLVVAVTGNTTSYMWNENGVRRVTVNLTPGVMTVFPRGSLHAMQNNGCDNAMLVSALDSEDPGTLNILNGLWALPRDMVRAAFGLGGAGDFNVEDVGGRVPDIAYGAAMGSAECMAKCGIKEGGGKGESEVEG